ncbi:hypothetical protein ACKFKF_20110 [Phormidesmis sp. 146-12]
MQLNRSTKFLSVIVLVAVLSLVTGVPMVQPVSADPINLLKRSNRSSALPKFIADQVRRDLSRRVRVPLKKLRIRTAEKRTWRNSCLELARPDELCGQALVEGWRVVVARNQQTWVYHTDREGRVLRVAGIQEQSLPASVENAVFRDAVAQSNLSRSALRITQAEQRTWSDGCLGLAEKEAFCTQALVPGWLVVVEATGQRWVYRTNFSGSMVKLDQSTRETLLKPVQIPVNDLPKLPQSVIFRAIASGGFAGQTQQTVLLQDGRLIRSRLNPNGTASLLQTTQISSQQMRQFQQVMAAIKAYDRLSYPATPGSADIITVTLSTRAGTVQYSDSIQTHLPQPLQTVIAAWRRLDQAS